MELTQRDRADERRQPSRQKSGEDAVADQDVSSESELEARALMMNAEYIDEAKMKRIQSMLTDTKRKVAAIVFG